jgi:hypothetical protein
VLEFGVARPHDHLTIDVRARAVTSEPPEAPEAPWEHLDGDTYAEAAGEFLLAGDDEPDDAALADLLDIARARTPLATLRWLNELIPDRFAYRPGVTYVGSTIQDLLDAGAGVCQDFVHLGLVLLRRNGIAARYVSGYLFSAPEDGSLDSGRAARGRRRPDQPAAGGGDPRQDRPRPHLRRRPADQGRLPRCRRRRAGGVGADDQAGSRRIGTRVAPAPNDRTPPGPETAASRHRPVPNVAPLFSQPRYPAKSTRSGASRFFAPGRRAPHFPFSVHLDGSPLWPAETCALL